MKKTFDFLSTMEVMSLRPSATLELETIEAHLRASMADPSASWWDDDEEEGGLGYERLPDGTAVIRVEGPIMSRSFWWSRYYRCACTPDIAQALDKAVLDGAISRIVLYLDSPGGAVAGLTALADKLYAARSGQKPITAYIANEGCSAAYWLASQCRRIYTRPESLVGCIGTITWLASYKAMLDTNGIAYEPIISDGAEDYKATGSPQKAITDADREYLKTIVNDMQALFNAGLERGLGLSSAQIASLADGRAHVGTRALELGLVDGITTWQEALTLAASAQPEPRPKADDSEDDEDDSETEDRSSATESTASRGGKSPGQSRTGGRETMTLKDRILAAFKGGSESNDEKLEGAAETIATLTAERDGFKAEAEAYRAEHESALEAAAIREFGQTEGPAIAAGFKGLPIATIKAKASAWNASADKKLGTDPEKPAQRATAPSALPTGVDAQQAAGGKLWDKLTPEQQATGAKFAPTDAAKESYAANLLKGAQ